MSADRVLCCLWHHAKHFALLLVNRQQCLVLQSGQNIRASSTVATPIDSAAAGFYCTNPNNAFKDNAASGGWTGFSFPVRLSLPSSTLKVDILPPSGLLTVHLLLRIASPARVRWYLIAYN